MSKLKMDSDSFIPVKIHGIYDSSKRKVVKVSLDESDIDMELLLLGERPNLKECIMEVTLILDAGGV